MRLKKKGRVTIEQIEREVSEAEYMRHAAGGFARAARALRAMDGTFLHRHGVEP